MNFVQVKLIAIDVDGTLLNDNYSISVRTKAAIKQAQDIGVKIVLATGRGPTSCIPIVEELQLKDPLITHNGAVIVDPTSQKLTFEIGFSTEELRPILTYCRSKNLHFDVNTAFEMHVEQVSSEAEFMYEKFYMQPKRWQDVSLLEGQIVKFSIFAEEAKLDVAFDELTSLCKDWRMIRSGEMFIDIIHPHATKGYSLQYLLDSYGIDFKDVIAFGNYFNDLEMIQLAGLGVAMDNSPEQVKELADRVTSSNNEDGVAVLLEEIFNISYIG